jgi:OOP family OmpA-OmpF porin
LQLSTRRAAAVRAYLVRQGVGADRLVARGYGETRPIADNATAEGRSRNRRVELKQIEAGLKP